MSFTRAGKCPENAPGAPVTSPIYDTARQMIADMAARRISARELLDAHVARNEALAAKLNCVIATDIEHARDTAQFIDDARARGAAMGVLAGLPMTIKDGFDVDGMPAMAGNPRYADRPKECTDAELVDRVRKADAIVWGKTNVPFMLGDFQSYNAVSGTTNNPYDVSRTPGGSSGGAAAALAAGITPLEIGSDLGGSLRHPANFCGVFSLKPTWGVLPQRGHIPPPPGIVSESDLNVMGPMARNAGDLRLLWNTLRGSAGTAPRDITDSHVVLWDIEPGFPLAREVREHVGRAAEALQRRGASVERKSLPFSGEELLRAYLELLLPIMAVGYPDNLRESFAAQKEADLQAGRDGAGPFSGALYRLRSMASDQDVFAAISRRKALKDRLAEFFTKDVDAILCPISPVPAFEHLRKLLPLERTLDVDGTTVPYLSMLTWISLATALHAPAMAVPAGRNAAGLPIGVQLIGPWNCEDRLFDFAGVLEEELGGFAAPTLSEEDSPRRHGERGAR
jgi:amidase